MLQGDASLFDVEDNGRLMVKAPLPVGIFSVAVVAYNPVTYIGDMMKNHTQILQISVQVNGFYLAIYKTQFTLII